MTRRVAITGLGVVSACGMGVEALARGIAAGRPVLSPLPFPATGFPHAQGGCAPERSQLARLLTRRKDLKLQNPDALLAVAAGVLAWQDAGLSPETVEPEGVGLFLAVGVEKGEVTELAPGVAAALGPAGDRLDLQRLADGGLARIHPLDSLKTLPNMALAHLAIRLGLRGPSLALCGSPDAGRHALAEALEAIAAGECELALAGGTDSLVSFAGYVQAWRQGLLDGGAFPGEGAAIFVLEELGAARARGAPPPYAEPVRPPRPELLATVAGVCGVASWPLALAAACCGCGRQEAVG